MIPIHVVDHVLEFYELCRSLSWEGEVKDSIDLNYCEEFHQAFYFSSKGEQLWVFDL